MSKRRLAVNIAVIGLTSAFCGYGVYFGYRLGSTYIMSVFGVLALAVSLVTLMLNVVMNQRSSSERDMMRALMGPCEHELCGRLQFGHHRAVSGDVYLCRDGILVHDREWRMFPRKDVISVDVVGVRGVQAKLRDGRKFRLSVDGGMDSGLRTNVLRYGSTYAV